VNAKIEGQEFNFVEIVGTTTVEQNIGNQTLSFESIWTAYSDDGFAISIKTAENLTDMDLGSYSFSSSDSINLFMIEKYSGAYEASVFETPDGGWEHYEYQGQFTIESKLQGLFQMTTGRFSLEALKDGQVIYHVTDGSFSI
jgi:hypothetical protein